MANNVLISIITINYNNLEGLKKTMASVLGQTWTAFEYIVIDGGSTDGSEAYIDSQSNNIDYWVSEPDSGIYNAMNKGIKVAKGEYLLFLNSGDWLFDKKVLAKVSIELSDCDVVYGNMMKIMTDDKLHLDKGPNGKYISLITFFKGTLNHASSFIKRNLFSKYGLYDENLKIVADWKFFLLALGLNNSKVKYIDIEVSYFDMKGISNMNLNLRNSERSKVLKELIPSPIYVDYKELMNSNTNIKADWFMIKLILKIHKKYAILKSKFRI